MTSFAQRVYWAATLNSGLYEEVEADRKSLGQAMGVVVISSIAAAVGANMYAGIYDLVSAMMIALITWVLWAWLTYFIGTRLLRSEETQADFGEVLRTTGFSSAPGLFRIFGFLPVVGMPIFVLSHIWMLVAFVIAVRNALDFGSLKRAVAVCALGWIISGVVFFAFVIDAR
jgi:hypothetical protein